MSDGRERRALRTVLVANRGEIAVRIIQACRERGLRSVAVYSEVDRDSLHVTLADEAHPIGPAAAAESYLHVPRILDVAVASSVDAVHPGYGFLAENPGFARACRETGLIFVGPSPEAMEAMGGKIPARRLAEELGIPVVPGESTPIESLEQARDVAARIGYPLAFKASSGGGGRGLKVVRGEDELAAALESARREGQAYFGDPTVFIERYVAEPRHVEVQILADEHGAAVSLGQRDCSVQRNHQKLIEEAPALVEQSVGAAMDEAALRLVRAIDYAGAGTLEFLVDGDRFYFLEMNTRIQVEHTVTELVTGVDLVQAQLRIAAGEPLWFDQDDVRVQGHAMQCRINAEDPSHGFRPAPGTLTAYRPPSGAGVRIDSHCYQGYSIPPTYDSMIAKLIVYADDREAARQRMLRALDEFILEGPPTTIPFHQRALQHPDFIAARPTTGFVGRLDLADLANVPRRRFPQPRTAASSVSPNGSGDELPANGRRFAVRIEGQSFTVDVAELGAQALVSGRRARDRHRGSGNDGGTVVSPMHGVVIRVPVAEGDAVEPGSVICVIEAMKMENEVLAATAGQIVSIAIKVGDTVDSGAAIATIQAT